MALNSSASVKFNHFDLFISYPKKTKWKEIISNVQYELRNRYKVNFWLDYEQTQNNSDLLKEAKTGIELSKLFLCFMNRDYLLSYNCKEELKHSIKLNKPKIIILLDNECENAMKILLPNENDNIKIEAYNDLNSFQICKGDYFEMFIHLLFAWLEPNDEDEAMHEEKSIMEINNSLKIVISPKLNDLDKNKLLEFFQNNRKSGGGEILTFEFRDNNQMLEITFKNYETKQNVLSLKSLSFQNHKLTIHDGEEFLNADDYVDINKAGKKNILVLETNLETS